MEERKIDYDSLVSVLRDMREEASAIFFVSACWNQQLTICQACIDAGITPNLSYDYGKTVLIQAAGNERKKLTVEVAEFLINNGAMINAADNTGKTALTKACETDNVKLAEYLINNGASISIKSKFTDNLSEAVKVGNKELVKLLVEKGASIDGSRALIVAVNEGYCEIVEWLLNHGAKPDSKNYYREIPIITATKKERCDIVSLLLKFGADPNCYEPASGGDGGRMPIHIAVDKGNVEIAQVLLENNADVNAHIEKESICIKKYNGALTPMDIAVFKNDANMQELLSKYGAKTSDKNERIQALTGIDVSSI